LVVAIIKIYIAPLWSMYCSEKKKKLMDNTSKNVALVFQNNLRQDNSMQAAILRTASRAINNVDWL
jgi:hypothetical protein